MSEVALKRSDMLGNGALERMQEHGRISGDVQVGSARGGVRYDNALQMMEMAKLLAVSDVAVPKHLRANPGACLKIIMQADEWGMSPFAVADQSYLVGDRISYMSMLVHALVERRAPLEGRLRGEWSGEGQTRRCKITGRLIGESEPFVWEGPMLKDIKVKNSPEWANNTDKQLWYHATRDWARMYCPDVLLGVYTRDELDNTELGPNRAREGGTIADRLPAVAGGSGFDANGIARTLGQPQIEQEEPAGTSEPEEQEPTPAARKTRSKAKAEKEPEQQEPETDGELEQAAGTPLSEPTTAAEYTAWAERWIGNAEEAIPAAQRWEAERELRAACRVSVTERKRIEKLLSEKFKG